MSNTLDTIYNEDCLKTMNRMADSSIDLTITSPPYNLGNDHHTGAVRHNPYEDDLPEKEYQQQQLEVLNELYRVTKDTGSLFYNHKNRIRKGSQITPYEWLLKSDWIVKQEIVWFNGSQNFDKIRFYPMTERVYWLVKLADTKLENNISHHDLFDWKAQGTNKKHKRSFPEQMVSDILVCIPDAQIVYDPYMGSGTVARVCKNMGRKYIGSEISKEYCEIAELRLGQGILL